MKYVRYRHNFCHQVNVFAMEANGIPPSIFPFMVLKGNPGDSLV
jgi:hypothetical protein